MTAQDIFDWIAGLFANRPPKVMGGQPRSPHWPQVRSKYLELHPTCEACGSKEKLQVHHCKPYHLHPALELDLSNLVCLCSKNSCHFLIGHLTAWESFNPDVLEDARKMRIKIRTRPQPIMVEYD